MREGQRAILDTPLVRLRLFARAKLGKPIRTGAAADLFEILWRLLLLSLEPHFAALSANRFQIAR